MFSYYLDNFYPSNSFNNQLNNPSLITNKDPEHLYNLFYYSFQYSYFDKINEFKISFYSFNVNITKDKVNSLIKLYNFYYKNFYDYLLKTVDFDFYETAQEILKDLFNHVIKIKN